MSNSIINIMKKKIDKGNESVFYEKTHSLFYNNSVEECLVYFLKKGYIIKSVTLNNITTNIPLKTDFDFMNNCYDYTLSIDEVNLSSLGIKNALDLESDINESIKHIDPFSNYMDSNFIYMIDLQSIKHDKLTKIIENIQLDIDRLGYKLFLYYDDKKEKYQSIEIHNEILDIILNDNKYLCKHINYCNTGTAYGSNVSEAIENYCKNLLPMAKEFASLINDTINKIESLYSKNYNKEELLQFLKLEER